MAMKNIITNTVMMKNIGTNTTAAIKDLFLNEYPQLCCGWNGQGNRLSSLIVPINRINLDNSKLVT